MQAKLKKIRVSAIVDAVDPVDPYFKIGRDKETGE
jgi:hypothetical protein